MSTSQCQCKLGEQSYIKAVFMVEILTPKSGNSELWLPQWTITRGSFSVLHYCVCTPQSMSKYQWLSYGCCGNYSFGFWYVSAFKFSTQPWTTVKITTVAEVSISSFLFLVTAEGDLGEQWVLPVVWMMDIPWVSLPSPTKCFGCTLKVYKD